MYYASINGKIYCFGTDLPTDDTDGDAGDVTLFLIDFGRNQFNYPSTD
jgi:hypothetical protein